MGYLVKIDVVTNKEVKPYQVMGCAVRTNSKMLKKLEFGVDNENEHQ